MATKTREIFFECSFTSRHASRTAYLRAWTAAEAEELFRAELAEEGVDAPGKIVVTPHDARPAWLSVAPHGAQAH